MQIGARVRVREGTILNIKAGYEGKVLGFNRGTGNPAVQFIGYAGVHSSSGCAVEGYPEGTVYLLSNNLRPINRFSVKGRENLYD